MRVLTYALRSRSRTSFSWEPSLRSLLLTFCAAVMLAGCGGSSSGGGGTPGGDQGGNDGGGATELPSGTLIPEVNGLQGDANYQGLLFYTMTTDSEEEPDPTVPSSTPDRYKLVAVNPHGLSVDKHTVSTNLQRLHEHRGIALSFPSADIDTNNNSISNYRINRILFQKKIGGTQFEQKFVETDASAWPPVPLNVNTDLGLIGVALSQDNLQDPARSVVTYGGLTSARFFQNPIDASGQIVEFEDSTANSLTPKVPLMNGSTHRPVGWLVFSENMPNESFRLLQYAIDGTELGEVTDENNQPVVDSFITGSSVQPFPGGVFSDGSQLLVLEEPKSGTDPVQLHKVVYQFTPGAPGQPGSLKKLRNSAGDALELPTINSILLDRVAIANDAVYMAIDASGTNEGNSIYRLDQNGWEKLLQTESKANPLTLILAGRYLVWQAPTESGGLYDRSLYSFDTVTEKLIILDQKIGSTNPVADKPAVVVNLGDPVYGNADGSIYYGRKRAMKIKVGETTFGQPPHEITIPDYETHYWVEAVTRRADGSGEPVIINDATWIAASTNGKGPLQGHVSLAQITPRAGGGIFPRGRTKSMELGEVFFIKGVMTDSDDSTTELVDPALYAISATNPAAGMVKLGDLPADTHGYEYNVMGLDGWNDITGEMGAGPHRLLTIGRSDFKSSVIYVNTRKKDSLEILDTSNGTGSANTAREVRGF